MGVSLRRKYRTAERSRGNAPSSTEVFLFPCCVICMPKGNIQLIRYLAIHEIRLSVRHTRIFFYISNEPNIYLFFIVDLSLRLIIITSSDSNEIIELVIRHRKHYRFRYNELQLSHQRDRVEVAVCDVTRKIDL